MLAGMWPEYIALTNAPDAWNQHRNLPNLEGFENFRFLMVVFVGCNGSGAPQEMSSKPEILVLDVVNASLNEVKEVVKKTKCATWIGATTFGVEIHDLPTWVIQVFHC